MAQKKRRSHEKPKAVICGPRKKRSDEPPKPQLSNHKKRAVWFQSRAAFPLREAPVRKLVEERQRAVKSLPPVTTGAHWELAGPTNIGGRCTAIVAHPKNADRIWIGAAGGGVWYSADAGKTWEFQWDDQDILNIGSLAIDPETPATLYCGTGEANLSADSYAGVGLYQTTDGGAHWFLLASSDVTGIPRRIGTIAIDPFDTKRIFLGGIGYGEMSQGSTDIGGLFVSKDGGTSWQRDNSFSPNVYWCHAIRFHPTARDVVYAAVTEHGARSGIYRSDDGGTTWKHLVDGLPEPERFGRASIAISPSNPNILYVLAADALSQYADGLLGIFRSANGGDNWTDVTTDFGSEGQMSYGNTIAIHPEDENHVLCGGVDLHLSTDGGASWTAVTKWDANRGDKNYAHADHHALLMPETAPGRVYDPNDGGIDVSDDGGVTWRNRSNGLEVTMYYDIDVAQTDIRMFGGGAQDNGTLITNSGSANDHYEILGGDGGWMVIDPRDADHFFASYYNFGIWKWQKGRNPADVSPKTTDAERSSVWMCFIDFDPNHSSVIFTGTHRVWRTVDDAKNWKAVSPDLDGSVISAIEICAADSKRIYVGTENGGIFRSTNGGTKWSANISGSMLPGHSVTRLISSSRDALTLYATFANFGHSHVFRSRDGGTSWEDIDKHRLPDVPHHSIVAIANGPTDRLFVANDAGVYSSDDGGATWSNLSRNLPHVMCVDLVYHAAKDTLFVATYGRSIWRLAL